MSIKSAWKEISGRMTAATEKAHMAYSFLSTEERQDLTSKIVLGVVSLAIAADPKTDILLSLGLTWFSAKMTVDARDVLLFNPWTQKALDSSVHALLPSKPQKIFGPDFRL